MRKFLKIAVIFVVVSLDILGIIYIVDAVTPSKTAQETIRYVDVKNNVSKSVGLDVQSSEIPAASSCNPEIQRRVDGYIEMLGTADVRFDDVDEIYRFASSADAKDARGIDRLKTMAKCYHDAVPIVLEIIAGSVGRDEARTILIPINQAASVWKKTDGAKDDLYNFREAIQTLYVVRDTYKEKDLNYLDFVYLDASNPIRNVVTFAGMIEAKRMFRDKISLRNF